MNRNTLAGRAAAPVLHSLRGDGCSLPGRQVGRGSRRAALLVASASIFFALLPGCTVGPDYHPPSMSVPPHFTTPGSSARPAEIPAIELKRWWETFNDPVLNTLIEQAIVTNLDVRLAEARVREARAQFEATRATLAPTLDGTASYTRSRFGSTTIGSPASGGSSTAPITPIGGAVNLYQAGFDAGWELDVFGGKRRAMEAARDNLQAQSEARRNALVTLLGEVAQNYISLRGFQYQLAVVTNNAAVQQDTLHLQKSKLQAGIATDLDVANAETQAATTESQIPTLRTQIQQAIHQLSVLLDREPTALEPQLETVAPLPVGPPAIPPGLPSELLRRRPDVRQAERNLAAANANIGVATADLFPKLNLTGALGVESLSLKSLANASSAFWSFGPAISWRIFDAGQIRANIRVQRARAQESMIQYRQVVLQSLQDVENTLVAYHQEQIRRGSLQQAVDSSRRAVKLATRLNQAGVVDFLNVLNAQLTLYQSEIQLAQSEQNVSTDLVALYKSLGGGWEVTEPRASR